MAAARVEDKMAGEAEATGSGSQGIGSVARVDTELVHSHPEQNWRELWCRELKLQEMGRGRERRGSWVFS